MFEGGQNSGIVSRQDCTEFEDALRRLYALENKLTDQVGSMFYQYFVWLVFLSKGVKEHLCMYIYVPFVISVWESTSIVLLSDWVRVMTGRHWRPRDASQVTTLAEVPVLKGKYNSGASWYPRTETEMGSAPGGEGHHQHVQTLPSQTTVEVVQGGRNLGF